MTSPQALCGGFDLAAGINDGVVVPARPGRRTSGASARTVAHGAPVRTGMAVPR